MIKKRTLNLLLLSLLFMLFAGCGTDKVQKETPDAGAENDAGNSYFSMKPSVVIQANPKIGLAPLSVDFSAIVASGDAPLNYAWNFGDGGNAATHETTYVFNAAGNFTVTVVVTDASGDQAQDSVIISVEDDLTPSVEITADPMTGIAPLPVYFTANVFSGNSPFTYSWDFDGDSNEDSAVANPGNIFSAGTHTVSLTVTDVDGDDASDTIDVDVLAPDGEPTVAAVVTSGDCVIPDRDEGSIVMLDASGSADDESTLMFEWLFQSKPADSEAEFSSSSIANPTFYADENGTYEVMVVVSDGTHKISSDILTIIASDEAADVTIVQGNDQTTTTDENFDESFKVLVSNSCGAPIPDARVFWRGSHLRIGFGGYYYYSGNSDAFTYTGDDGIATQVQVRAGHDIADPTSLTASSGCAEAIFNLTVNIGPENIIMAMPANPIQVSSSIGLPITIQLADYGSNPLTFPDVQFDLEMTCGSTSGLCWFGGTEQEQVLRNVTTENGVATIVIFSITTDPVRLFLPMGTYIRTIEGGNVGRQLENIYGLRNILEDDFENASPFTTEQETNQWEYGIPTSGPGSAYSGDNVIATNLAEDYTPFVEPDRDSNDLGYEWIIIPLTDDGLTTDGYWVEFYHWYDMNTDTCDECSPATGLVHTSHNGYAYPYVGYPGPEQCYDYGGYIKNGYSTYWGFGRHSNGWEKVRFYTEMNNEDKGEKAGPSGEYVMFEFLTNPAVDANGPGWYIDDLKVQVFSNGIAYYKFLSGDPDHAVFDEYGFQGVSSSASEDCIAYGTVAIFAQDKFDQAILEPGIQLEIELTTVSVDTEAPGVPSIHQIIEGTKISESGGKTIIETGENGYVKIAIRNDSNRGETVQVNAVIVGVSGSDATLGLPFAHPEVFNNTGECCDSPIDMGNGTAFNNFSVFLNSYYATDSLSECGSVEKKDVVYEFTITETQLYLLNINGDPYSVYEIRDITNGCPGTVITDGDESDDDNCFMSHTDNYAYLEAGHTYLLAVSERFDTGNKIVSIGIGVNIYPADDGPK